MSYQFEEENGDDIGEADSLEEVKENHVDEFKCDGN